MAIKKNTPAPVQAATVTAPAAEEVQPNATTPAPDSGFASGTEDNSPNTPEPAQSSSQATTTEPVTTKAVRLGWTQPKFNALVRTIFAMAPSTTTTNEDGSTSQGKIMLADLVEQLKTVPEFAGDMEVLSSPDGSIRLLNKIRESRKARKLAIEEGNTSVKQLPEVSNATGVRGGKRSGVDLLADVDENEEAA